MFPLSEFFSVCFYPVTHAQAGSRSIDLSMSDSFPHCEWEHPGGIKQGERQRMGTIWGSHGPGGKHPPAWCSWRLFQCHKHCVLSALSLVGKPLTQAVYLSNLCGKTKKWGLWADDPGAHPLLFHLLWGRNCGETGLSRLGDVSSGESPSCSSHPLQYIFVFSF